MSQIFIRGVELPSKVRGVTVKQEDDFIIFVNTFLCPETQKQAASHEIRHIKKDHFYNEELVVINELEAN